jgi:hypothetical protein
MTEETPAQVALKVARSRSEDLIKRGVGTDLLIALADVEVRAEQARQQELANLISLMANPPACPFPARDVLDRIKELVRL